MNQIKFNLTDLSVEEVNTILAALQEVPAKFSNPLSMKIRQQAEAQLPKPEDESGELKPVPAE
jgi:hypothetical protein